jgi:hypothetical protein
MYKLYVPSGVNGKFNAALDILHYDCEIAVPLTLILTLKFLQNPKI